MNVTAADHEERVDRAGERIAGRYRLLREVGSGGMGVVYEAINTWTDRRVAIKFMNRTMRDAPRATIPADLSERFMREARATARVEHPNAVDVLDMGRDTERDSLYIVYEFLDGEPLRALLDRRGWLKPAEAEEILAPVMEALAFAHRTGVVHRDLKPENIFLSRTADGRTVPKVIDFGIARVTESDGMPNLTRTGMTLGTARYMSPEQARGLTDVDARTDVWAMGVVWFEALTGKVPYDGENYNAVLAKLVTQDPPPLRSTLPEAPETLAAAIDGALRRDRDARYATMQHFLDAIRGGHVVAGIHSPPPSAEPAATEPATPDPPAPPAEQPLAFATTASARPSVGSPARTPRTRLGLGLGLLGVALAALFIAALRSSPAPLSHPPRLSQSPPPPVPTAILPPPSVTQLDTPTSASAPLTAPFAPNAAQTDAGARPLRVTTRRLAPPARHAATGSSATASSPPEATPAPVTGTNGAPVLEP